LHICDYNYNNAIQHVIRSLLIKVFHLSILFSIVYAVFCFDSFCISVCHASNYALFASLPASVALLLQSETVELQYISDCYDCD